MECRSCRPLLHLGSDHAGKAQDLVVDDEPQITRVLKASLGMHGYEIQVANDGEAGLDAFMIGSPTWSSRICRCRK